jgi:hypothetical protein
MSMRVHVASGEVVWSLNTDLVGMTFQELKTWIQQRGYQLERLAEHFHTCVDYPSQPCPACNEHGRERLPDGMWEVRCRALEPMVSGW